MCCRGAGFQLVLWRDFFQVGQQGWQVFAYYFPKHVFIHAHVIVDDPMPHSDDLPPRDLGVSVLKLRRDLAGSFPDDLHNMR